MNESPTSFDPDDHSLEAPLKPKQQIALEALLAGKYNTEAAEEAGVERRTVGRWLKEDVDFRAAYNRRLQARQDRADRRAWSLLDKTFDAIEQALDQGDARLALKLAEKMGALTGDRPPVGSTNVTAIRIGDVLRKFVRDEQAFAAYLRVLLEALAGRKDDRQILEAMKTISRSTGHGSAETNARHAHQARHFVVDSDQDDDEMGLKEALSRLAEMQESERKKD